MKKLPDWNPFKYLNPVTAGLDGLKDKHFVIPDWMNEKQVHLFNKWQPYIGIIEKDNAYLMQFDFIGSGREDIHVKIGHRRLTVTAKRNISEGEVGEQVYMEKQDEQKFDRTFVLPAIIDTGKAEAHYEKGVLNIVLPKQNEEEHELDID